MLMKWTSWIAAFLALILFCFFMFQSDAFQSCISKSYYESAEHEPPKGAPQILRSLHWAETCSGEFFKADGEAITAFFTLVLGAATIGLWWSSKGMVKAGERTAELQLRAYLSIESAFFDTDPSGRWAINIKLKNSGQTPAYDVRATVEREFSAPKNESVVFPLTNDADVFPSFTFGAHSPHTVHLPCDEPPLEIPRGQNGWHAVSQSDMRAYLWGRIDYVTFDKPQWTTFQMVNYFSSVTNFSFCAVGNDSSRQ